MSTGAKVSKPSRRLSEDYEHDLEPPVVKRQKLDDKPKISLQDLSDEIVLQIFRHLSPMDLLWLSEACSVFRRVCSDKTLWTRVDTCSGHNPLSLRDFRKMLKYLHDKTRSISVWGFLKTASNARKESISPSVLKTIEERCPQLEEFVLEECFIDASKTPLSTFPKSLKTLRIRNCELVNIPDQGNFFKNVESITPELTVLDLLGSGWLSNHSLMAVCKCSKLEEISLQGCFRVGECFAYTALACRFGFRSLKKADLRDTSATNSEVPCFGKLPEITQLYLGYTSPVPDDKENISDRGLIALLPDMNNGTKAKMEKLSLTHTRITDSMLEELVRDLSLKWIDVTGSKVTQEGVNLAKSINPSCDIIHESNSLS